MTDYYGDVVIQSAGFRCGGKNWSAATIEGSGHVRSNDRETLHELSDGLTGYVNSNNERVYNLIKRE
jgi:hypothetical protein